MCLFRVFISERFSNSSVAFFFLVIAEMKKKIRQVDACLSLDNSFITLNS